MNEESCESRGATLTGFLFGNIDKHGRLEDDLFDEDSKRHLSGLNEISGVASLVTEITGNEEIKAESNEELVKSSDAVDFSDIADMAEDVDSKVVGLSEIKEESAETVNGISNELVPGIKTENDEIKLEPIDTETTETKPEIRPALMRVPSSTYMPLSSLVGENPELSQSAIAHIFPEFRRGQVLRFSRLFKPVYRPSIWKKRKRALSESKEVATIKEEDKENNEEFGVDVKTMKMKQELDAGFTLNLGRMPNPDEVDNSDLEKLLQPVHEEIEEALKEECNVEKKLNVAPWRYGPSQLWYDMLCVDPLGQNFNYGFKLKDEGDEEPLKMVKSDLPEDAYHMVTQTKWEDDIIWNNEEARQRISQARHQIRSLGAGWVASSSSRTYKQYLAQQENLKQCGNQRANRNFPSGVPNPDDVHVDENACMFPIENEDLIYGNWEDRIIWDNTQMKSIPRPSILTLDLNDENIIIDLPADQDQHDVAKKPLIKKEKEVKKSKILLGKAGIIKEEEEEEEEEEETPQIDDPFNISNDEFYNPKLAADAVLRTNIGGTVIQHSTPAVELMQPFFPTFLSVTKLRRFHRPPLKRYSHGPMSMGGLQPVLPLRKNILRKAKQRESERNASGGGDMFFMRTPEDLTGRDGDVFLAEYSEEFPPLLMQVGMATKIKNYYKRKPGKDNPPPLYKHGELAYAHTSPFLGSLAPGQSLQALENLMFRAPIYEFSMASTDFLLIRNRQHYYIRDVKTLYCVGQQCPLLEVPGPNSKRANNFQRDFLQVFIYRLFMMNKDEPRRIRMEDIRKAFPSHAEASIRKRLKLCADFKRTGQDSNWWVIKPGFRLPSEEELRAMVSPEQCCAYYSMLAAEQHLKDAGYGEKSFFALDDDNEEETALKMDDEVKTAPWNTTRAYISALKGRCLLALTGVADPTGIGEGFSYVKVPNKPTQDKELGQQATPKKQTVTGTDADLRRLSLKDAKALLRKFGVNDAEIKKLSRWEVIDVVRTMSTEQVKQGQEEGMSKFARGNRFSIAEHQERYKEECQRIFELQNRVLSSKEILSTDDNESSGGESDWEEMGKNIENLLSNKKSHRDIGREQEEAERRELQKMMMGGGEKKEKKKSELEDDSIDNQKKRLKITRTFRDESGREYRRTEIVTKRVVIDAYVRIRQSNKSMLIRQFATLDDSQKEEMKKERRRLQEQLRRIKKNEQKEVGSAISKESPNKKKKKKKDIANFKMKCGACGAVGHMRTNKECPLYHRTEIQPPIVVAVTEEQQEDLEKVELDDPDLIKNEGTKIIFSKTLVDHAASVRIKSLKIKIPKNALQPGKRRRTGDVSHCDYLKKPRQSANRRRADPVVSLSSIFEGILNEMRELPDTKPFLNPVNQKLVPDYYKIVKVPMDLQTIRENIRCRKYQSRESFLVDVNHVVANCSTYNGPKSVLTFTAQKMFELCLQRIAEKEDKLMRLEKAINPLLDENNLVALSYILEGVVNDRLKHVENSWPFHKPVNKKFVKDYYEKIKLPMDLDTILKNIQKQQYHSSDSFLSDVALIVSNCEQYNGPVSDHTKTARQILQVAREALDEQVEQLRPIEDALKACREAALDAAETDSVVTGTSVTGDLLGAEVESMDSFAATRSLDLFAAGDASIASSGYEERTRFEGKMFESSATAVDCLLTKDRDGYIDVDGIELADRIKEDPHSTNLSQDLAVSPEPDDEEDEENEAEEEEDSKHQFANVSMAQSVKLEADNEFSNYEYSNYDAANVRNVSEILPAGNEDSFDPTEFFSSLAKNNEKMQEQIEAIRAEDKNKEKTPKTSFEDINADLQLSESDSGDE